MPRQSAGGRRFDAHRIRCDAAVDAQPPQRPRARGPLRGASRGLLVEANNQPASVIPRKARDQAGIDRFANDENGQTGEP